MAIWRCEVCRFHYDESHGLKEDGISAGTKWEDIHPEWICPDCGVAKNRFRKLDQ